jgi:hypothetical protein
MKDWFSRITADLIGAGTATPEEAMAHYRYQHETKLKEAVEVTFPVLLKKLGPEWNGLWKAFREENKISPRNLDHFPEVFLNYFFTTSASTELKELARFEHRLDTHPWTHQTLPLKTDFTFAENSRIVLGSHEVISFSAPVTRMYDEKEPGTDSETVLLWQKESGTFYRTLSAWELDVFLALPEGVEQALELAPEDPAVVSDFFQWLGSSCLIQGLKED